MDILFINPGNQKGIYQELAREFTAIDTPIWACLLAEAMRRKGYEVAIHDTNVEGWNDHIGAPWAKLRPRLVVIPVYGHHPSASTQTMPAVHALLPALRKALPETPIALTGTHPAALPERTLGEEKHADYILLGDGLHSLTGLMKTLDGKLPPSRVPGLWYRSESGPTTTGPALPLGNLDEELPGYAWDLLPPLENYRAHNWHCFQSFESSSKSDFTDVRTPYASLYTSLGCPFACDYCCIRTLFGKPGIKYWSIPTVIGWIDTLVAKHHVRNIRLADELFLLSPERVTQFCDLLIERDYGLNIWAYARVDTIPDDLLPRLKAAGINWLCLGIESGNEQVRAGVHKRLKRDIVTTVRTIQAHGIHIIGNYMFGLPSDDLATMQQTLDLALELNCEFANFYTVMAYPGSPLYARSEAAGLTPERWEAFSQHGYWTQPLPTQTLTAAQVQTFRDRAFDTYFNNPDYLHMIQTRFGNKTCSHLDKMLRIPVKRKLLESSEI